MKLNERYNKLIEEVSHQSRHHPDESLQQFYVALLKKIDENNEVKELVINVLKKRQDITIKHVTNLLYRAFQYILIFRKNLSNYGNNSADEWELLIDEVLEKKEHKEKYVELLLHENTQTTIYQRYLGPKAALSAYFDGAPISVIDVGCGLNLGLPGIEHNYPFLEIKDNSKEHKVADLSKEKLNISKGYAIDINNPIEKKEWALACGFYPQEIENLPNVKRMCEDLWEKTSVEFFQGSITCLAKIWRENELEPVDAIIASTVLYQFPEEEIEAAIKIMNKVLKPNGIIIINDFVVTNGKLTWKVHWFKKQKSSYKTVILEKGASLEEAKEFITWDNGRCREGTPGKDFQEIVQLRR